MKPTDRKRLVKSGKSVLEAKKNGGKEAKMPFFLPLPKAPRFETHFRSGKNKIYF